MRPTLPSTFGTFILLGSRHVRTRLPCRLLGRRSPRQPDVAVGTRTRSDKGLEAALDSYGECPNLDEDNRTWIKNLLEFANQSFAASKKAEIPQNAQGAMAHQCRRAATSVHYANERCHNGKKPKPD